MGTDRVLSDKDAQVASFIDSQPKDVPISVNEANQNIFALPKECEPYASKDYDFRWVSKDSRMMDRAKVKGWIVCNRVHNPWLPDYMIAAHGGVEKYGHVLAFRRKEVSNALRTKIQAQSIENINKATKTAEKDKEGSPFYSAKLSAEEERAEEGTGNSEMVQGKDF